MRIIAKKRGMPENHYDSIAGIMASNPEEANCIRIPSSMRKCNTWRNGLMAGTLGGYGKKIQAHQT
jgi:hypothetical protein